MSQANETPERVQGTDGIRREVRLASGIEFAGLSPQEVFLHKGFITEEFMELYAYAHVSGLMRNGEIQAGDEIVVGWDPRDVKGDFTRAVVRGIRKAKADAVVVGVVPTPLVPTYAIYRNSGGGFMITASHNPKDQNGIKIFSAFRGMKLLPDNDVELTKRILSLDYKTVKKLPPTGKEIDCREEALQLFREFSLLPENTWVEPQPGQRLSFKDIVLVVDPANGSLSGIAAGVFREMGFGRVVEVNARLDGNVNLFSGVADLEGHSEIKPDSIEKGSGHFHRHKAVKKLFELGRKYAAEIQAGRKKVCGAVFDADADRFYRLDYNPFKDSVLVLSGDETAFLQARYLIARDPERYKGSLYVNTVESDLNAGVSAGQLGLKPVLAAVGDKWILLRIARMIAESRLKFLKRNIAAGLSANLQDKWEKLIKGETLNVRGFLEMENSLDQLERNLPGENKPPDYGDLLSLAVGSEETGHNITPGWLVRKDGSQVPVFFGNGLKSAINTFAATEYLFRGKNPRFALSRIHKPFKPGFKETFYAYYIDQKLFRNNSPVWNRVKRNIFARAKELGCQSKVKKFPEDPDMLYIGMKRGGDKENASPVREGAVFVRNSGTENKISVNLRGDRKDARDLKAIGESSIRILMTALKDAKSHYYRLELDILSQVAGQPVPESRLALDKESGGRVLAEMKKQNLVESTRKGCRLTQRGKWYITSHPGSGKAGQ